MLLILVLEEEPVVMKILARALKGHIVLKAATAEQALTVFKQCHCRIDVLIAGLTLPKSSGVQIALLLRSQTPRLAVILTSGYPVTSWSDRDASDLSRLSPVGLRIVQKPFRSSAIQDAIRELTMGRALYSNGTSAPAGAWEPSS